MVTQQDLPPVGRREADGIRFLRNVRVELFNTLAAPLTPQQAYYAKPEAGIGFTANYGTVVVR